MCGCGGVGAVRGGVGLVGLSLKEIARYAEESSVKPVLPSLVTGVQDNAHNNGVQRKARKGCPNSLIFQDINAAGAWVWKAVPCDRWVCSACYEWRLETELIPEIVAALDWAKETGWTLKFVTLTYLDTDLGAQQTKEGRDRRRLDIAHFKQALKRKCVSFEYLKIVETHKSGRIHLHFLVMMPFVYQSVLVKAWQGATRGTSRIVDIEAAAMKCPRCYPGPKAPRTEKRRSMIVPPPGRGECLCCSYRPDWASFVLGEVAEAIAKELAKYLTKELGSSPDKARVKKLTRSKLWKARCCAGGEDDLPKLCVTCGGVHTFVFVGKLDRLVKDGFGLLEDLKRDEPIVYYPNGSEVVNCWGDGAVFLESEADARWRGLIDVKGLSDSEIEEMMSQRE